MDHITRGNDGYLDEPAETYQWDDTVPNHAALSVGDAIVLWDKKALIGASVIEDIEEGSATKPVYRCTFCGGAHIQRRSTLEPPWRCFRCRRNSTNRSSRPSPSTLTPRGMTSDGSISMASSPARSSRELCVSPGSQLSLRPLRWAAFRSTVESAVPGDSLTVVDFRGEHTWRHRLATVRLRLGQGRFRRALLEEQGLVCAISGPDPPAALEAAHLCSYAAVGMHHSHGGFLPRRDVHRLFDLGQIAVNPADLCVDVSPEVIGYPSYAALHASAMVVEVGDRQRTWLAAHWAEHRT